MTLRRTGASAAGAAAFAALLDCAAFGTSGDGSAPPPVEAATNDTDVVADSSVSDAAVDASACVPRIDERFAWRTAVEAPWTAVIGKGGTLTPEYDGGAEGILRIAAPPNTAGPPTAYLKQSLPRVPRRVHCTFRFSAKTAFTNTKSSYTDIFQLIGRYPGTIIRLQLGFDGRGDLRVRDDHVGADTGDCNVVSCPLRPVPPERERGAMFDRSVDATFGFDTDFDDVTVTRNGQLIMSGHIGLPPLDTLEIGYGLVNFGDKAQEGTFGPLVCEFDC